VRSCSVCVCSENSHTPPFCVCVCVWDCVCLCVCVCVIVRTLLCVCKYIYMYWVECGCACGREFFRTILKEHTSLKYEYGMAHTIASLATHMHTSYRRLYKSTSHSNIRAIWLTYIYKGAYISVSHTTHMNVSCRRFVVPVKGT